MMIQNIEEAIQRIEAIPELSGKLVYDHFTEPQKLPFAAYVYDFNTDGADDFKGLQQINFQLEIYSEIREFALESKILLAFSDVEVSTESDYIDSERMHMTVFRFSFAQKLTQFE